jgi:hypothetical protein
MGGHRPVRTQFKGKAALTTSTRWLVSVKKAGPAFASAYGASPRRTEVLDVFRCERKC